MFTCRVIYHSVRVIMWALDFAANLHSLHFLMFNNTETDQCFVLSSLLVVCWGRKLVIFHTLEIARLPRNHKCGRLSVCGFSAECSTTTYSKPTYERTHSPQNLWWKACQFASWTKILASVTLTFSTSLASLALDKTHIVHVCNWKFFTFPHPPCFLLSRKFWAEVRPSFDHNIDWTLFLVTSVESYTKYFQYFIQHIQRSYA